MPTQPMTVEAGLRNHRTHFARESEFGVTGTDPDFLAYSNGVRAFNWSPGVGLEPRRALGTVNPVEHLRAPESHELTVTYDLTKWFTQNGGEAYDASYDGLVRDSDNLLPYSHTIINREDKSRIAAASTVAGNTVRPTRIYTVGFGALIDELTITGDPSDQQPISVELNYIAQKVRSYQIDQPTSTEAPTEVTVASTSDNDTTQTVTIEDEGAVNTEAVALTGTTAVSTTATYSDIDAIELDAETEGDVVISINEGSQASPTPGDTIARIFGTQTYVGIEGDLGIPALGAGTFEDPSGLPAAEQFIGDEILRSGTPYPYSIPSASMGISNNIETNVQGDSFGMALHPGNRELTIEADMYGEAHSHAVVIDHLTNNPRDLTWSMTGGDVVFTDCGLVDPGERSLEEGQAVMTMSNSFEPLDISITEA